MNTATAYDLFQNADSLSVKGLLLIAIGFIAATPTLRFAIAFVVKYGFTSFGRYRIAVGSRFLLMQIQ